MLLSSVAESMYWCGRYVERAQALSRVVSSYLRLGMDLPSARPLDLKPLMPLADGAQGDKMPTTRAGLLQALVFDETNTSSVSGALNAARENLRNARVSVPPELWQILNRLYGRVGEARGRSEAVLLDALDETLAAGQRFDGERTAGMLRDAAHAFLSIGCLLERADMQLRTLGVLAPVLHPEGWERAFDDVRWAGLLDALGMTSMYRSVHHLNADLTRLLSLLLIAGDCPRSLAFCLRGIERQLRALPRAARVRAALGVAERDGAALSRASRDQVSLDLERALSALAELHATLEASYFPGASSAPAEQADARSGPSSEAADPFAYLGREHETTSCVLLVLDELAARAAGGEPIDRHDLASVVSYLTDFGEQSHHEKEESILTPELVASGFDWYDGPLAVMRREHRQEHHLVRTLSGLALGEVWSSETARAFVSVAREYSHFMRGHMDHERRDLFDQAARALSAEAKQRLLAAFRSFDAERPVNFAGLLVDELLQKYQPETRNRAAG